MRLSFFCCRKMNFPPHLSCGLLRNTSVFCFVLFKKFCFFLLLSCISSLALGVRLAVWNWGVTWFRPSSATLKSRTNQDPISFSAAWVNMGWLWECPFIHLYNEGRSWLEQSNVVSSYALLLCRAKAVSTVMLVPFCQGWHDYTVFSFLFLSCQYLTVVTAVV